VGRKKRIDEPNPTSSPHDFYWFHRHWPSSRVRRMLICFARFFYLEQVNEYWWTSLPLRWTDKLVIFFLRQCFFFVDGNVGRQPVTSCSSEQQLYMRRKKNWIISLAIT
jgi:hypothetical protein